MTDSLLFPERTFLFRKITDRNFRGVAKPDNRQSGRYFQLRLNDDEAKTMYDEGWNVKTMRGTKKDRQSSSLLVCIISGKTLPDITVWHRVGEGKRQIGLDELGMLDTIDIGDADVVLSPVPWAAGSTRGIKAYLKKLDIYKEARGIGECHNTSYNR